MSGVDVATDLKRAEALREIGRAADAITILSRVVAGSPSNAQALCQLAQCYNATRDHYSMLSAADRAAAANPQSEWAHRLRSLALHNLGRHPEAVATHQRLRQGDVPRARPHERFAHRQLGAHMAPRVLNIR